MKVQAQAQAQAVQVDCSASSAILFEPSSGRVLYEKNAHIRRPMASTTKLMTALLAAETLSPQAELTATAQALATEGSSMGLREGDRIACEDLLYGLMLSSGNDAANVFALTMAESFDAFAEQMNARAQCLGMTNSHFVTPSGLDAEGHGASAYDMALLAAAVLKNERLAKVCATVTKTVKVGEREVTFTNHNRLLTTLEGCVGLKTGYTSQSGRCLVSATTRNGVTLIAVTLDCSNDWEEHRVLMEEGFSLLERVTLSLPERVTLPCFGGVRSTVEVKTVPTSAVVLKSDEPLVVRVKLPRYVWAPIEKGEALGTAFYYIGDTCVASALLEAAESMPPKEKNSWPETMWSLVCRLFREAVSG